MTRSLAMGVGERVVCVRSLIKTLPLSPFLLCRRVGLVVSALDFRPEGRWFELVFAVVFRNFILHCLSSSRVPAIIILGEGELAMD